MRLLLSNIMGLGNSFLSLKAVVRRFSLAKLEGTQIRISQTMTRPFTFCGSNYTYNSSLRNRHYQGTI